MLAPVILAVVASIAGHPTQVACDADTNPSPFPSPPGYAADAWTYTNGTTIHMSQRLCDDTSAPIGTAQFATGIAVSLHEAARARGIVTDSCVEMTADIGVFDILRRFFSVPFFTPASVEVGAQVLALTRSQLPPSYQPEACWSSGVYR